MQPRRRFWSACRDSSVWIRATKLGLPVGAAQVALNQGDHWVAGTVTVAVVAKTILSPALSFLIAFISAAATRADVSAPSS
jgi:hypothetical protein